MAILLVCLEPVRIPERLVEMLKTKITPKHSIAFLHLVIIALLLVLVLLLLVSWGTAVNYENSREEQTLTGTLGEFPTPEPSASASAGPNAR